VDIFSATIASALKIRKDQAESAIQLLDAGNTIPFIARYRKEATGILDEEQLRQVSEQLARLRTLEDRRATIITSISEQEKLTPELKLQILNCTTLTALEDIYLPYKPKRRTRASIARENGLQPLAEWLLKQPRTGQKPEQAANDYLSEKVPSIEDALAGARDIVAETISENATVRASLREKALQRSQFQVAKDPASEDPRQVYQTYYQFDLPVSRLRPHQVLAINR
jgi:protein Tex